MFGPTTPTASCRSRSTPWYSGVSCTNTRTGSGSVSSGKNVPLNRNIGRITSWIRSKSCHVRMNDVAAIPTAANAKPIRRAPGTVRKISGDRTRPMTNITARKPTA